MARKPKANREVVQDDTAAEGGEGQHGAATEQTQTFEDTNEIMTNEHHEMQQVAPATQDLIIAGLSFTVKAPYTAGHTLTPGEAKALNQTLAENLRNNFAKKVRELKGERATLSDDEKAKLDEELALYEAAYSFDKVRTSGPRTVHVNPVEREAFKSASAFVEAALNAKGISKKALKPENFKQLVLDVLEKRPEIREAARRHVEALNAVAHDAIAGLADAELDFKDDAAEGGEGEDLTDLDSEAAFG